MSRFLQIILMVLFVVPAAFAQVTTSSLKGKIADTKGETLIGASVLAVHVPSGTQYGTITDESGNFFIPGVRVGGPYSITVSYVGFDDMSVNDIYANLGVAADVNIKMQETGILVDEVVVTANRNDIFSSDRTGAAVTFNNKAIQAIPTIGRTVADITRYNVYSNGRGSFAGQDSRFSSFTIDGSVFNNGFGLGGSASAGGRTGTTAISFDALEEVQYNITPYDIRQSGFAGAGINAVTRSGTNEVDGSIYYLARNKDLVGKRVDGKLLPAFTLDEKTFGARIGGAIIPNKLFYFVNYENFASSNPALDWVLNKPGATGNVSRTTLTDMQDLSRFVSENFGRDLGALEGYNNAIDSKKGLIRLDYNISNKHKASLRYSHHDSGSDARISDSNSSNTAGFGNRSNRVDAISPENTGYKIADNTRSIAFELNSLLSNKMSNNIVIGYNKQIEDRTYKTDIFPTIDILKDGRTYTSIGFDPFTPNNKLNYSTLNITDNLNVYAGKHTFTLGGAFEYFTSNNVFFPSSNGVYTFNSIDDFKKAVAQYKEAPNATTSIVSMARFNLRYSLLPNGAEPLQVLKTSTFSLYGQDEMQVSNKLTVSAGLRADLVSYDNSTAVDFNNPVVAGLTYKDENNADLKVTTGSFPKATVLFSPRLGFNYDLSDNKSFQIRGGSGLFVSRIPQVLVSNQLGNNGVNTVAIVANNTTAYPFTLDASKYAPKTTDITKLPAYVINASAQDLKYPYVWKTSLAVDKKLGSGFALTVEGIFNKNLKALRYIDANLKPATAAFTGPDTRPRFPASNLTGTAINPARFINQQTTNVFVLTNTNKGRAYSITTKLERSAALGLGGFIGYTYGNATDVQAVGSTVQANIPTGIGQNGLIESISDNNLKHRAVGFLNYAIQTGDKEFGLTNISLAATYSAGSPFTYTYGGDMNGDGQTNDLIFVPNKGSDLTFTALTAGGKTFTPDQQAAAFESYIASNKFLNANRGKILERGVAEFPSLFRMDLAVSHKFGLELGGKKRSIEARVDVLNFGNYLNNKWGVGNVSTTANPLTLASVSATGVPSYRMATQIIEGSTELLKDSFLKSLNIDNAWQMQFGLRLNF
jgi:hypothetical protein